MKKVYSLILILALSATTFIVRAQRHQFHGWVFRLITGGMKHFMELPGQATRWGRGHETYGEDPFLTGRMGYEFVRGMQGDDPKYLKTVATALRKPYIIWYFA